MGMHKMGLLKNRRYNTDTLKTDNCFFLIPALVPLWIMSINISTMINKQKFLIKLVNTKLNNKIPFCVPIFVNNREAENLA